MPVTSHLFSVFDQYHWWKIRLHYLAMGKGHTNILSHRRTKKNTLAHDFFTHYEIRNNFVFKVWQEKKNPALPHDVFSCCEIRSKDIFKAGLSIETNLSNSNCCVVIKCFSYLEHYYVDAQRSCSICEWHVMCSLIEKAETGRCLRHGIASWPAPSHWNCWIWQKPDYH